MTPRRPAEVGVTASRTRTVEAADIERFTEMTGDRNPLHCDESVATRSRFGQIIGHCCVEGNRLGSG